MITSRTILRWTITIGIVFGACVCAWAKTEAPGWLQSALQDDATGWEEQSSSMVLLDRGDITYLPGGKVLKTLKSVVRLKKEDGLAEVAPIMFYDANTDKILNAQAWIVSVDGKKIRSYGRADFTDMVAQLDQRFWHAKRVITFNRKEDVGVGEVLAWEFQVEAQTGMSDCRWYFRMRQPVLKSVFSVTPLPKRKLVSFAANQKVPEPEPGDTPGSLRWTQRRIRPLHTEAERTFFPTLMTVSVRCVSDDNLAGRLETWESFAALAADIIEPQVVIDETVVAKATALAKGKTERWDRIRAVTEFAQKQIAYLSVNLGEDSLAGYRPHLPAEVIKNGLGDCKDKATLTIALLRQLGEKAWVMLVNSGNPGAVTPAWPSSSFNHAIVAIAAGDDVPASWPQIDGGVLGKLILFDATDPGVPLGVLPVSDQGGHGIVVSKQTAGLALLPTETPLENLLTQRVTGKIDEIGNIETVVEETRTGSSGAVDHHTRINQGPEKFTHSLETRLHDAMPLIKNLKWKDEWNLTNARSQLNYSFLAENGAQHASSDLLLVCPRLINRNLRLSPWKKGEEGQFWLRAFGIHEVVTLYIPDGFTLGTLPTAWQQTTPAATTSISYHLSGQTLTYEFELKQNAGLFRQAEYETLRTFYRTIDEMDRRPVVMNRARKDP